MEKRRTCLITLVLLGWSVSSLSQDLERIGKEDPLKISGGVNFNNIFYGVQGIKQRRDPYSYFISGSLGFNIYGWSVPFSFTLSNQNNTFQQPFNQYSLHPSYKWVTAHIGYTSMTFSPYTLNGHLFNGIGVDLEPEGKFRFSAMYGRLRRAVEPDSLTEQSNLPSFRRMGFGFKASYKVDQDFVDIILFRAADQVKSIRYVPDSVGILPEENLVLSIAAGKMILKRVKLTGEIASSAITRDVRADEIESSSTIFSYTGGLFTPRLSSSYYNAIKTGIAYQGDNYTLGIGYERIDPGYRTLGSYYFNNDLENITVNGSVVFFEGKLNVVANVGTQHDNLDESKTSTMKRGVGSISIGYTPSDKLNITSSYSNFTTFTNIRSQFVDINQLTPYDNLDTLNFTQIAQNANVNVNYMLPSSDEVRKNVNLNITLQNAADKQGGVQQPSGSTFYNFNAAYSLNYVPSRFGVAAAFNINQNQITELNSLTLGPTLSVRKSLKDNKMRLSASSSWNNSYSNGEILSRVVNFRLGWNMTWLDKHNISATGVVLNRTNMGESATSEFTEFTGTIGYSYNF